MSQEKILQEILENTEELSISSEKFDELTQNLEVDEMDYLLTQLNKLGINITTDSAENKTILEEAGDVGFIKKLSSRVDDPTRMYLNEISNYKLLDANEEIVYANRLQEGKIAKKELDLLKATSSIDCEKIKQLEEKIALGEVAREVMINSNLRLVVAVARKYLNRGVPFLDLVQEGNIGLIKAINTFDPKMGNRISTHATWWIKNYVIRALSTQARSIRIPNYLQDQIKKYTKYRFEFEQINHRFPTTEEASKALGMSSEKIEILRENAQQITSMDEKIKEDDDMTILDNFVDSKHLNPAQYALNEEYREVIDSLLKSLPPREEMVLRLRFGFYDGVPHTLEDVSNRFGLTRERVRQIENHAIMRLKHPSKAKVLAEYKK